jgi:photosystem II stability/assembly factor-like uncharacterized protein
MTMKRTAAMTWAVAVTLGCGAAYAAEPNALQALMTRPAPMQAQPQNEMLLAAARAGTRTVAVGAHGLVLLSDDGQRFRQASVPVALTLTGVTFVDDRTGWATGHAGAILSTDDAGEHWTLQRSDFGTDQPLFSVHFLNKDEGWAVGLWSLMLHTRDGGKTWERTALPPPPGSHKADLNLFKVFADPQGTLYVTAERGHVLRSTDRGATWEYLVTGYQGSLWTGVALADGALLVAGLRGSMYRSGDAGRSWTAVPLGQTSSITSLVQVGSTVYGAGFDGLLLSSTDGGHHFTVARRDDRLPLTALVATAAGGVTVFSKMGVPPQPTVKPVAAP